MKQRVIGFDLARCFAIFGMVVVNFKTAMSPDTNGHDWLLSLTGLLDGRAAATFVILAGIGLSLMSQSARQAGDGQALSLVRNTLLKRSLFLFVVGLSFSPIWIADILHYYGVYIAIAAFCLALTTRQLWGLTAGLVCGFFLLVLLLDYEQNWDWSTLSYEGFWTFRGFALNLFFNGFHPVIPWLGFMLVGLIIGRIDLTSKNKRARVFLSGMIVAILAEGLSWVVTHQVQTTPEEQGDLMALLGTAPMPPMPLYMLAAGGTATSIIALCVGLGERFHDSRFLQPLVATGQLALSLYVAHVFLGLGVLESTGNLTGQTIVFSVTASIGFCLASVLFSHLWRKKFTRGPLEHMMRWLT